MNFTAGKLTVEGDATIKELEKAGAFEHLKIRREKDDPFPVVPFWKKQKNILVFIAAILAIAGWSVSLSMGEGHPAAIILFLTSMVVGGYNLFWQGLKNLSRLEFDMKTLMTVAVIGAAIIGEWGEGAVVVILFAISEALETFSMENARRSIRSLIDTAPKEALVKRNGKEIILPIDQIEINDHIIVKPGEKLALDGVVVTGLSAVNQATITGESVPVTKQEKDEVYAGTLNEEGVLEIRVTRHAEDTTLAKIIHLVEEAQEERAPAQQFVDRFAKYYTPAIMVFALLVAIVPPVFLAAEWSQWIYLGLATLVVGCPCALVISTPVAIVTAISNSARNGVLIKGGLYLEQAGTVNAIAFDKTGTLTRGVPAVTDVVPLNSTEEEIMSIACAVEKHSQHPLARAIVRKAEETGNLQDHEVSEAASLTGKGMKAEVNGKTVFAASPSYVSDTYPQLINKELNDKTIQLQEQGKTVVLVGSEERLFGIIALQDEVRKQAAHVLRQLNTAGIKRTIMLTGDNPATAAAIGKTAGVTDIRAGLLPEEKLAEINRLKRGGVRVAMVGDGMNDAPALAAADLGIAMGTIGTDAALETADAALMGDDLKKLPYLIKLSRLTLKIIKQNIIFSLALKALALMLVPFGVLTLWIAIFADMGATLLVTLNSLRLMKVKDEE